MARPARSSSFREYPAGPAPEWGWGRRRRGQPVPPAPTVPAVPIFTITMS